MSTVQQPVPLSTAGTGAGPAGTITLVTDRFTLAIPDSALTLEGFREWATGPEFPEWVRVAFLAGEIVLDMSNEDPETHALVKGEITRVLMNLNRERKLGKIYPDGVLLTNTQAGLSNNPDAVFFLPKSLQSGRIRLVPRRDQEGRYRELEGSPDWVLEVISDGSVQKDSTRLREAYHRAGVREYWLVDARGEELVFQILLHRKKGYVAAPSQEDWQRSSVFGATFRLVRQADEMGLGEYTLEVREE
jgi:Uma2 family endonuclease